MPIKAVLQTIDGKILDSVIDIEGGLNRALPIGDSAYPLLRYVDPYGNAMFNGKQMMEIIDELNAIIDKSPDENQRALLGRVRELAMKCLGANHWYLRFVGD